MTTLTLHDPTGTTEVSQPHAERLSIETARAENFVIVVAGGGHLTNAYWIAGCSPHVIGRTIRVPETLDTLIEESRASLTGATVTP